MYIVTGASGFVGRVLVSRLAQDAPGVAVSRVDRRQYSLPLDWSWMLREQVLSRNINATCLVHCEVAHHILWPDPQLERVIWNTNVDGTDAWLRWCATRGVTRFVHFSSIKAVDPGVDRPTDERANGSRDSVYGRSKWAAEELVRRWVRADPTRSAVIVRPSVVYGPGNVANVAAMMQAIDRNRFFLVGPNSNVKSMVSVRNVAAAVTHLATRMSPAGCEVYNLVDRESYSIRQIDAMIRVKLGRAGNSPTLPVALARVAAKFGDAFHRVSGRSFPINSTRLDALLEHTHFSCEKLLATGFLHPQTTEEGLGEMVDWYLKQA